MRQWVSKGGWSLGVTSAQAGLEASPLASDLASSAQGPESLEEEGRGLGWAQFSQLPQPLCTREAVLPQTWQDERALVSPQALSRGSGASWDSERPSQMPARRSAPPFSCRAFPPGAAASRSVPHGPGSAPQRCSHSTTVTSRGEAG